MKGFLAYPVLITLLFGTPAFADFADGDAAYDKGDYATALKEWRPLAEQGDSKAQFNLGLMHTYGQGVTRDQKKAFRWFKLAAEQGIRRAQHSLGLMYLDGQGVTQDDKAALRWFKLAAEQGYAGAQNNLGVMYANGRGVTQDFIRAYMWWNIAASHGNEDAIRGRDIIEEQMTPAQVKIALDLAVECVAKDYKDC